MHRSILIAALLAMLLTATPALAQTTLGRPSDVPIGGVTEDGFVRAASDVFAECGPAEPVFVQQYAGACAEAGFPILDAPPSEPSVPAGTPPEPAARESAGGPTSDGSSGAPPSVPDTGGAPLLLVAGLLLAGVLGFVAHRSTR